MSFEYRSGIGYDVHKLVEGRDCIIGGVKINFHKGLLGHSDADVLAHAIADALLGAGGFGDIGTFFPDTDAQFKGMDSMKILEHVANHLRANGFEIVNIDSVVIAEVPKINPHRVAMQNRMSEVLGLEASRLGVKATTNEKMGFLGRQEGIAAQAVASIKKAI
jgi:2-C-methyl-D-erythritol 2,4-cyclodiphosphate synthase|tara:strand:+ start:687 stop:1175 length:489 start_codon:yes stop_codon:yes gene_type:complete